MSECKVCSAEMESNHRRYGAPSCNACAAFFQRSIKIHKEFVCENSDQCLIEPSKQGKQCLKCRFSKCLQMGMISREYIRAQKESTKLNSAEIVFARITDTLLTTSLHLSSYLKEYLENGNPEVMKISLELANNAKMDSVPERIELLASLFTKNPITQTEFAVFTNICLCKLEYSRISESEKEKIKALQNSAFQKLPISPIEGHRFLDLVILSSRFLEIFYANF
uniref:Nuclear receptor domain-containing protein n=1 Tax=Panagrolaimus superbus TaxID=310955 RepID=A0A914YHL1_9BILA